MPSGTNEGSRPIHDWTAHQVDTTVDFACSNPVLTWFLGGLNFQVEHPLFPKVCHLHYPALSRLVRETAEKHGVRILYNAEMVGLNRCGVVVMLESRH